MRNPPQHVAGRQRQKGIRAFRLGILGLGEVLAVGADPIPAFGAQGALHAFMDPVFGHHQSSNAVKKRTFLAKLLRSAGKTLVVSVADSGENSVGGLEPRGEARHAASLRNAHLDEPH